MERWKELANKTHKKLPPVIKLNTLLVTENVFRKGIESGLIEYHEKHDVFLFGMARVIINEDAPMIKTHEDYVNSITKGGDNV